MGGPACGLVVPLESNEVVRIAVDRMIRAVYVPEGIEFGKDPRGRRAKRYRKQVRLQETDLKSGCFHVQDTRAIEGRFFTLSYPMSCSPPPPREQSFRNEDEDAELSEIFGFPLPLTEWEIVTFVNGREAHRALADIAAYLSEQTGGVISFGGCLKETVAAELPGRVVTTGGGKTGRPRRMFLDAVAMRAWSRRSDCYMCK